ncbi:MAG TPA: DUF177 domain-containing protein [Gaiella sp.]|jgi:uncharacterized protein
MTRFSLRNLRLRPGEEHRERIEIDLEPFTLGGAAYEPVPGTVEAVLAIQRAQSGDVFRLRLATRVEGQCMRCLGPAAVDVAVDAQEYESSDRAAAEDLRSEYVRDGELEVGAWAHDQVALALPEPILCRPDCAGLCPVCGKNLNDEPHEHEEVVSDPRWAALEALRTDASEED